MSSSYARSRLAARLIVPVGLGLADAIILLNLTWPFNPVLSRLSLLAGLALIFVLPGLAWLQAFRWLRTQCGLERIVLVGSLSVAISSLALLVAVYWPEPLDLAQILVALNASTLVGVAMDWIQTRKKSPADRQPEPSGRPTWPATTVLVILLTILGVAVFLRLYSLGYGEFHEDELENMRLAVRAMKGEEFAPFLDSKGPIHWLLPAALWSMHGWINEAIARLVFAISSALTVLAVYVLGKRMVGPVVGLIGSGLIAVNGLLIAYARHVENPSLIVLWSVVAAWCAYRFYQDRNAPTRATGQTLILGGFLLGIGLVTHPNMVLYVIPFLLMIGLTYWHRPELWRRTWKWCLASLLVIAGLAATFYVPFILDPYFEHAVEYFAEERVGTGFLYNSVAGLLSLEADYSTRYLMPLVILFSGVALFKEIRKLGKFGIVAAVILGAAMVSSVLWPELWVWGPVNAALLPYTVFFLMLVLSPHTSFEVKSLILWFGIPYVALAFFAQDAATHVRNVYPALMLLAAIGALIYWKSLSGRWGRLARVATTVVAACILSLMLYYEYFEFLGRVSDYWHIETQAKSRPDSIYSVLYGEIPRPRKLVSNPRLGGWKVIGSLYDQGQIQGDFRSINESFAVPIWYTHQTPRSCFVDPGNYFVRIDVRGEPEEIEQLRDNGYGLTRVILVDEKPKLYVFEKNTPSANEPAVFDLKDYRAGFDRSATLERYVSEPPVQHPMQVMFGSQLMLRGYDIGSTQLAAGDTLEITLHWQAIAPMSENYRAFVHVETDRIWGQHDDSPACRLRTDEWRPPQTGQGQFRVTLDTTMPPGTYPVTVGIYNPDTGERLEIFDAQGQSLGNVLELTSIEVVPEP